ncbi:FecR family protein [Mangrovibacterium lignilyticum]|uniref:FecR family protein n=1 Tax=Mangrovibacterium lignilyticum TaxID=2668052 RepID=UPI0013D42E7B|nr:FecR family protein [Mangrovibacterium lignilyticum]
MNKDHFDISILVGKYLSNELSAEDREELDKWLSQSGENQFWFEKVTSENYKKEKLKMLRSVKTEAGWQTMVERRNKKRAIRRLQSLTKYAAVVVLLFATAVWVFKPSSTQENLEIAAENILPGSRQAKLVLSTGETIDLANSDDEVVEEKNGTRINLGKERLAYDDANPSSEVELAYNELIVPRGGEYSITLSDGTEVFLNADSKLRYPVKFSSGERNVELDGEAYFKVAHNKEAPFRVKTNDMQVEVLGTEFNISAYSEDNSIQTTLINGSVKATNLLHHQDIILEPGQQAELEKNSGQMSAENVDISFSVAWRNGLLRFDEKPLGEIMKTIERWYDVEVVFDDPEVAGIDFGCNLSRYSTIEPLMRIFEATGTVGVSIEGRTIHLSKVVKEQKAV